MNTMPSPKTVDLGRTSQAGSQVKADVHDVALADMRVARPAAAPPVRRRIIGGLAAVSFQVIFISALVYGTMHKIVPELESLAVVNILEETTLEEAEPPPPPPKFRTPEIQIQTPLVTITPPEPPPNAPTAVVKTAPPPAPPPVTRYAGTGEDPVISFQKALLRHLNRHKRYPPAARAKREQGVVYVRFAMDRRGRVLRANIERHSKYAPLDEEGLALLRRAQPLPMPPLELAGDPLELVVPVEFSLR